MMSLAPDLQSVIARWSNDQYVEPELLRGAVHKLREITTQDGNILPEGEIIYLANLAALMNRDLQKLETREVLRREGIACD